MKDNSSLVNTQNKETQKILFTSSPKVILNENKPLNTFPNIISLNNSFNYLQKYNVIKLNIINSHFSLFELYQQNNEYLTSDQISLINEIKDKYALSSLSVFNDMDKLIKKPEPLFIPNNQDNYYNENYFKNFNKINQKIISKNNYNFINDNNLLKQKRERSINESLINTNQTMINIDEDQKDESNKTSFHKKAIFHLFKKKNKIKYECFRGKKTPGRKKKNSGEIGAHNKFSKDNMMRKLKNKVMESARKLINKKIKDESNSDIKYCREIRKIEGVYSQELNIKFNFWFYFQKLKDIFQFKMSSKYSKGGLDSNYILINKIKEKTDIFPKTIKLFEMPFYQYYHDIFLGENPNWPAIFDIKEKDNKFQLDYFVNNSGLNKENDFLKYRNTIFKLAYNYEKFFLEKNPRITSNKKNEKQNYVKEIIKCINNENNALYKYKFIQQASFYRPELNIYLNISFSNKNNINEINFNKKRHNLEDYQNIINNENNNNNINNGNNINADYIKKVNDNGNNSINSNQNLKALESKKGEFFRIEKIKHKTINNNKNVDVTYSNIGDNNNNFLNTKNELIPNQNINYVTNNSINFSFKNEKECENDNKNREKENAEVNLSEKKDFEIFI